MDRIDITMTATIRPEILNRTLESFCRNLFSERDRYRLILNVDPAGENKAPEEVVSVARSYFDDVVFRIAYTPSFSMAVKWAWMQVVNPYVFHLEDDWELLVDLDMDVLLETLNTHDDVASLRLWKRKISGSIMTLSVDYLIYNSGNGLYLPIRKRDGYDRGKMSLNPTLIKGDFVVGARDLLVDFRNPEKQFRKTNIHMSEFLMDWRHGTYGYPGEGPWVKDIGKSWRKDHRLEKPGVNFLTWESI